MKFFTLCLLFVLLVVYAKAQVAEEFAPEDEVVPIRAKRQFGFGWGRPWGWGGWGRPWGWGGLGGWGYPYGGYWG
ncbi:hypothetical protein Y032_0208g2068 [Ancylostoma ceylanicum]|nr:hypothetical protein Y032_0208g2068 [Ancylostoma ceylanicum]